MHRLLFVCQWFWWVRLPEYDEFLSFLLSASPRAVDLGIQSFLAFVVAEVVWQSPCWPHDVVRKAHSRILSLLRHMPPFGLGNLIKLYPDGNQRVRDQIMRASSLPTPKCPPAAPPGGAIRGERGERECVDSCLHRGRDAGFPAPPAQIRTGPLGHPAPAFGQTSE